MNENMVLLDKNNSQLLKKKKIMNCMIPIST